MTVRFVSYNLYEGGGLVGERLEALQRIVKGLEPDVLGLAECNGFERDGLRTLFEWERALGMRGFLCQTRTGFHVALFLKNAVVRELHRTMDWFHHGALRAKVELAGTELTVIVTHLCPFSGESRIREAQYLSTYARDEHVIIMGDMNAISRKDVERIRFDQMLPHRRARHFMPGTETVDTRAIDVFEQAGLTDLFRRANPHEPGCTLPTPLVDGSKKAELRVDYVFGSDAMAQRLQGARVVVDDDARAASDHYPVVVEFDS